MNMVSQDEEHLRLLRIFHFVLAGITALGACVPFVHLTLGILMLTGNFPPGQRHGPPPPPMLGILFVVLGAGFILFGWLMAFLTFLAGRNLGQRKHFLFCQIVAGVMCIFFPFGTALGVFTLIVLARPSVRQLFQPSS